MYNHQLDTFIAAADYGSFAKAADAMYISVPAVMQQIKLLEGRCGFKLFDRTNRGVTLTAAGQSLYDDAKTLIRFSEDALNKAGQLAGVLENTVRIGTSLLFKCRILPDIWAEVCERIPELKIEIMSIPEKQSRDLSIAYIGTKYDVREGVYSSISLKGKCGFLKLIDSPLCCAVSKNHRLSHYTKITMDDLNGEYIIMPVRGAGEEMDSFRDEIKKNYPTIQVIDSSYYGTDTFTLCEFNQYVLVDAEIYADIHTNLVTIPLDTPRTMPYGLMYSNSPSPAAKRFIKAASEYKKKRNM